jgi:multiple sugar transport system substrate-binding protein
MGVLLAFVTIVLQSRRGFKMFARFVPALALTSSLLLSLTPAMAAGVTQLTFPPYTQQVSLTWWDWGTNDQAVVKMFEQHYPSIHVTVRNVGAGQPEYTKLLTVLKAGSGAPDVVQIEFERLPEFIATGDLRDLAPLGAARYATAFLPWTWNQVSRGKAIYAIPVDSGPTSLFYNTAIFSKYGLSVPKTWNDFLADAAKLHAANPKTYMTFFDPTGGSWFVSLAWAAGALPFRQTGANSWSINLTSPQFEKVAQFWGQLVQKGYAQAIGAFTADWSKNLASGRYASFVGAAWSPGYEIAPYAKPGSGWH